MFVFGSDYPELEPKYCIVGDVATKRFIKSFKEHKKLVFGKLRKVFPYGKGFSTDNAKIVSVNSVVYNFCGRLYTFFDNRFLETMVGKLVSKKEVETPKNCKYKMYLATFYDIVTQELFTKYMVEPVT